MDIEHQVLEICVDAGLRIDRRLLVRQQVVELDDADRDGFELLSLEHNLLENGVLDDLVGDDRGEMAGLSDIPPVITVERGIEVVAETLYVDILVSQIELERLTSRIQKSFCSSSTASSKFTEILFC